jgi:hypothetical protein
MPTHHQLRAYLALFACAALTVSAPAGAAAQSIVGRVTDSESSAPLVGAELVLLDDGGRPRVRGFSDSSGGFRIETQGAGRYRLRVTHLGHLEYTSTTLDVTRGEVVTVEIRMGIQAIPLDPLTVVARPTHQTAHLREFNERRENPGGLGGYYMTREQVERRPAATATKLLLEMPAVRVQPIITENNPMGMDRSLIVLQGTAGPCVANVYIDGIRARQSVDHSLDDLLDPSLIAGVELYPRALLAPIQYQADPGCGVVLYWTARPEGGEGWSLKRIIAGSVVLGGLIIGSFVIG